MTLSLSNEEYLDEEGVTDPVSRAACLEAMARHDGNRWWLRTTPEREFAYRQLYERVMLSSFDRFHKALEVLLGRPVYTHELAINYAGLCEEADEAWETGITRDPVQAEAQSIMSLIDYADKNGKKLIILKGDHDDTIV